MTRTFFDSSQLGLRCEPFPLALAHPIAGADTDREMVETFPALDRFAELSKGATRTRSASASAHASSPSSGGAPALAGAPPLREEQRVRAHRGEDGRGTDGRVVYDLRGDFGAEPTRVRERFVFHRERFAVQNEVT